MRPRPQQQYERKRIMSKEEDKILGGASTPAEAARAAAEPKPGKDEAKILGKTEKAGAKAVRQPDSVCAVRNVKTGVETRYPWSQAQHMFAAPVLRKLASEGKAESGDLSVRFV